jgi:predicted small secreted protein
MKLVATILAAIALTACGTIGGAVSGAGQDLSKAGEWIKNR